MISLGVITVVKSKGKYFTIRNSTRGMHQGILLLPKKKIPNIFLVQFNVVRTIVNFPAKFYVSKKSCKQFFTLINIHANANPKMLVARVTLEKNVQSFKVAFEITFLLQFLERIAFLVTLSFGNFF